jgi:two-component system, NtrC family, response regulator AtoC
MPMIPRTLANDADGAPGDLQILVVEGEAMATHDLPERGSLLVGRATDADVLLADPSTSAKHARVLVGGGGVSIEDLGSRNGTQLRGQKIPPNEPQVIAPGEAVLLGSAVLLVQRRGGAARPRRLWPHGYFEARLAEECDLAEGGGTPFSIARVDIDGGAGAESFLAAAEALRPSDIVGSYAPQAFEIILRRANSDTAQRVMEALVRRLRGAGIGARVALAHFPAHGQSAGALIERACAELRPRGAAADRASARDVVVVDERMREIYRLAEKAAGGVINVLVLGETGVGKEVLAETVHKASKRAGGPFLCLNCAALTENLLESELFGHERGAFTDAKTAKTGLLEAASGGTVFLDEIGEMSPTLQAKLLRVIETKQVTRVGGLKPVAIDVRFVSATHRDLVNEIREKRFRSDLYYRLNGLRLQIPPLRERRSEIRPLCDGFLARLAKESGLARVPCLTDDAAALLEAYSWPGNIRELRNVMERALLLSDGDDIEPDHLPLETLSAPVEVGTVAMAEVAADPPVMDDRWNAKEKSERARILEALRAEGGNQTRAAKKLGISRGTLLARLERFEIARPQKRPS